MQNYLFNLLFNSLIETAWLTGTIIIVGFVLGWLRERTIRNIQYSLGMRAINLTGMIGTVAHELSHLIVALIFRHKVVSFKLFQPPDQNGLMGWVEHQYKKSIYQMAGNFFIGIAPILGGTLVITLLMYLLVPEVFASYVAILTGSAMLTEPNEVDLFNLGAAYAGLYQSLFTGENLKNIGFLLFLFLGFCISTHMSLSHEDIKESFGGLCLIYVVIVVLNVMEWQLSFMPFNIVQYNVILTGFLLISVVMAIFSYLVSELIWFICPRVRG